MPTKSVDLVMERELSRKSCRLLLGSATMIVIVAREQSRMNCPKCSFENRDGSKFCNECGHPLPASGPLPIIEAPSSYRVSSHETADLSGIERMVDPGYAPPSPSWRSGSTAELPHLNDEHRRLRTYQAPV